MGRIDDFRRLTSTLDGGATPPPAAQARQDFNLDETSATEIYYGECNPGTPDNAPGHRIYRIKITNGVLTSKKWANGGQQTAKWSERTTLIYGDEVAPPPPNEEGDPPPPPPPPDTPNTLAIIKADMGLAATTVRAYSHGFIRAASTKALREASHPSTSITNWADQVNRILAWAWIWPNVDDTSTNTAVQVRYGEVYIKRISTNSWVRLFKGRPRGMRFNCNKSGGDQINATYNIETIIDAETVQVRPQMTNTTVGSERYNTWELWTPSNTIPVFGHDIAGVFCTFQAKLAVIDTGVADDRAASRFFAQQGFDTWFYPNDGKGFKQDINFNPIPSGGYPRKQMDGGGGRYKQITNNWQAFNFVSIPPTNSGSWGPPWATWASGTPNPWQVAPYVMTVAELDANPPPLNNYLNP